MWWVVLSLVSAAIVLRFIYLRGLRLSNGQAERTALARRQIIESLPAGAPPLPWHLGSKDLELAAKLKVGLETSGRTVRTQLAAGIGGDNLEILPGTGWIYTEPIAILSPLWDPDSESPATLVYVHRSAEAILLPIAGTYDLKRLGPSPDGSGTMYHRVRTNSDA